MTVWSALLVSSLHQPIRRRAMAVAWASSPSLARLCASTARPVSSPMMITQTACFVLLVITHQWLECTLVTSVLSVTTPCRVQLCVQPALLAQKILRRACKTCHPALSVAMASIQILQGLTVMLAQPMKQLMIVAASALATAPASPAMNAPTASALPAQWANTKP